MHSTGVKGFIAMVLASIGLMISGCNTSKATLDTFAKFTSSTSPGDWINADGVIKEHQKARLFTAVVFENLEQDIARGDGEYLTSLAVLLKVPSGEQEEFRTHSQRNYVRLFTPGGRTAESILGVLASKRLDFQADGALLEEDKDNQAKN
jgi:Protein of unknown function (DUF3015)